MNAFAYAYDQQVHVIVAERQRQATLARQARMAGKVNPNRSSLFDRARAVIGRMLIAAGEHLAAEPARSGSVRVAPRV